MSKWRCRQFKPAIHYQSMYSLVYYSASIPILFGSQTVFLVLRDCSKIIQTIPYFVFSYKRQSLRRSSQVIFVFFLKNHPMHIAISTCPSFFQVISITNNNKPQSDGQVVLIRLKAVQIFMKANSHVAQSSFLTLFITEKIYKNRSVTLT